MNIDYNAEVQTGKVVNTFDEKGYNNG